MRRSTAPSLEVQPADRERSAAHGKTALSLVVMTGALAGALAAPSAFAPEDTDDPDHIVGGPGAQYIRGMGGDDWLDGGPGTDSVRGGEGYYLADGGTGNDTPS